MIHKNPKWCIRLEIPNRQYSLNDIIWKKVEKIAQLTPQSNCAPFDNHYIFTCSTVGVIQVRLLLV